MRCSKSAALVVVAALGALWAWGLYAMARPALRPDRFEQVAPGMTREEVEILLGGPPGDYGRETGPAFMTLEGWGPPGGWPPGAVEEAWWDDTCRLEVVFDARGRVLGKHRRAGFVRGPD